MLYSMFVCVCVYVCFPECRRVRLNYQCVCVCGIFFFFLGGGGGGWVWSSMFILCFLCEYLQTEINFDQSQIRMKWDNSQFKVNIYSIDSQKTPSFLGMCFILTLLQQYARDMPSRNFHLLHRKRLEWREAHGFDLFYYQSVELCGN